MGYVNAGTLEFLVEPAGGFYFLEMNTRLPVEHPVTEAVRGVDLVQAELRVSAGEPVAWQQGEIVPQGAAIECRIYAEDPARNFLPSSGAITALRLPEGAGIRVECGVAEGLTVSVHYDPLLAKLIARGRDRPEALDRMRRALGEFRLEGVRTTIPFHREVLSCELFARGRLHTQLVEQGAFDA